MTLSSVFLLFEQAQSQPRGGGSMIAAIIPFILVFVIFYVLIIMPQRKRQKRHQQLIEQLKPGDRIITSGGVHGTVMGTQKDKIELKIAANVKIDLAKSAVAVILTPEEKAQKLK